MAPLNFMALLSFTELFSFPAVAAQQTQVPTKLPKPLANRGQPLVSVASGYKPEAQPTVKKPTVKQQP